MKILVSQQYYKLAKKKKKDWDPNPWAVCRSQQNEHGWDDEKTENCIKDVKKKQK